MKKLCQISLGALLLSTAALAANSTQISNATMFATPSSISGSGTYVFTSSMSQKQIQSTIDGIYALQRDNQFGNSHYCLMFEPGTYGSIANPLDVKVGYDTQVIGLGSTPDAVHIIGAVRSQDATPNDPTQPTGGPGACNNFWRSMENLSITPTLGSVAYTSVPKNQDVWAVSQAAPIRRIHIINGSLRLCDLGWSSGGFMSDSLINQDVITGSQQQWFTQNSEWSGNWGVGSWNMVFAGCVGNTPTPTTQSNPSLIGNVWQNWPYTHEDTIPVPMREKPYITQQNGVWGVEIPPMRKYFSGIDWKKDSPQGKFIPISKSNIVVPTSGSSTLSIEQALSKATNGWHIAIVSPGVYSIDTPIQVTQKNSIILGLGLPVLKDGGSGQVIHVGNVENAIIAGVIVAGGPMSGQATLVEIGDKNSRLGNANNPDMLFDLFVRIGGVSSSLEQANTAVVINNSHVIGDNLWLWRADHGDNVGWTKNVANHGLVVNGSNVTMLGLAVEHFEKTQTVWNGKHGKIIFYQSELPYDVPVQSDWMNGKMLGYPSLQITKSATDFYGSGLGVYSVFINTLGPVVCQNAIVDNAKKSQINHAIIVDLSGAKYQTGIESIVNGVGSSVGAINNGKMLSTIGNYKTK